MRSYMRQKKSIKKRAHFALLACGILFHAVSCTNSTFSGVSAKVGPKKPVIKVDDPNFPPGGLLSDQRKVEASSINRVWTVNTAGTVQRRTIDSDKVTETKTWSGILGGGGTRTYVTEGGFVAARFPNVYFIDPDAVQDGKPKAPEKFVFDDAVDRICLASYLKGDKRYLFAAYGNGKYRDIPMASEKPYRPLWNDPAVKKGQITITGNWGYSCFIDQTRKIFYSQLGTGYGAINLETLTAAPAGSNPNAGFTSSTALLNNLTKGTTPSSYSMSGDPAGNVYNGTGIYTMSYDSGSDSVWVSVINNTAYGDNNIGIFPRECLLSNKNCTGFAWYKGPESSNIGPMSALKDGRIIGLVRNTGTIYLMSLKNKADRTAGYAAVIIGNAGGDPYMYTDFTGATLYVKDAEQSFDLTKIKGYLPKKPVEGLFFSWNKKATAINNLWESITLEARCYSDTNSKPSYEVVKNVDESGKFTSIDVSSCKGKKIDYIDVKMSQQTGAATLGNVDFIQIGVKQ